MNKKLIRCISKPDMPFEEWALLKGIDLKKNAIKNKTCNKLRKEK